MIFNSFVSERHKPKNDFANIDRKYMREFRLRRNHPKQVATFMRESSSTTKTYHNLQSKKKGKDIQDSV